MPQENIEPNVIDFITEIAPLVLKDAQTEESKSFLAIHLRLFGIGKQQDNRILDKLAQFADKGNVRQIAQLVNIRPDLRLQVLFTLAGLGAQDEMEVIIKEHPEDLLIKEPLRDISGRVFHSSIFQHVLWTLDIRYMANMMLDCLPNTEQGEAIRCELVKQYQEWESEGLRYQLKGEWFESERHFSFQPLFDALASYLNHYDQWTKSQRLAHWCTIVGGEQTLVPAHVRHHYQDSEDLNKPKLKRSLTFYNWVQGKEQIWSQALDELGRDIAIYASVTNNSVFVAGCTGVDIREYALQNLLNLVALYEARITIDLPALKLRLDTPIKILEQGLTI